VCVLLGILENNGRSLLSTTTMVHDNKMKMKMAWFRQTSRFKKMVLSIAIGLKLTSGTIVSPNSLLRILLWLWLLFKWSLGVCSIRNSGK